MAKKYKKVNGHLAKQREKHKVDINELWNDNDQVCEILRDLEGRSRHDNLRANRRNFGEFV